MALGTTDFEKYPKYQLDKHGKVINQILTTAEQIFGMAVPKNETPQIKAEVLGGQNIKNDNKQPAIFTDDFTVNTETGSSYASLYIDPIKQYVAIANYATESDVCDIFNKVDEPDATDPSTLPLAETPIAEFVSTADGVMITTRFDSGAEVVDPFCFSVSTDEIGSLNIAEETYYQETLTLTDFNPVKLCLQTIKITTEGDNIETFDSIPACLYRISPGTPTIISSKSTNNSVISVVKAPTRDFLEAENKIPVLTNSDFNTSVEYFVKTCDYATGTILTSSIVQFGEGQLESTNIELELGEALYTKINMSFADTGDTFNSSNTILSIPTAVVANYKRLNAPNLSINKINKMATISFAAAAPETVLTTKAFIYNIRRFGQDDWSEDQIIAVPTSGDTTVSVQLDNVGDAIRVKACAECYQDSYYNYATLCECDPNQPDNDTVEGEIDYLASGIDSIVEVQYNVDQWIALLEDLLDNDNS